MAGNQTANFVVKAKDQATGPLGKIGTSLGKLKGTGLTALKGLAAGAAVAATAIAGLAVVAIKGAISEERSIILTNAALRQRGFELKTLAPLVEKQVVAFERFGLEGENVRAGIEAGSRFFKDQNELLQANAVAANIAAVTEQSLAEVMLTIGKAAQGQTRGLKALGIEVEKGAQLKDILAAADKKYAGIAEELANSTGGKMLAAQEQFNGAMDELGMDLLPMVNEVLGFLVKDALPAFREWMAQVGPFIGKFVDQYVRPLVDSFGQLFNALGGMENFGTLLSIVFLPLQIALQAIKVVIDAIIWGLKLIGVIAPGVGKSVDPMNDKYARGLSGNVQMGTGGGTTMVTNVSIGTQKVDTVVSNSLGRITPQGRNR
jgi:hypothetical protein